MSYKLLIYFSINENVGELIPVDDDENADDGDFDGDASDIYLIWTSKFYLRVHELKLYGL